MTSLRGLENLEVGPSKLERGFASPAVQSGSRGVKQGVNTMQMFNCIPYHTLTYTINIQLAYFEASQG